MPESLRIVSFLAFPLLGAGIGYTANRIAIRMLFRPLKAWRIFGVKLPLTPGLIPANRQALAAAIGEMVGRHLLTGAEISKALDNEKFQQHLLAVIRERVGSVFSRDFGPVAGLVSGNFRSYFDVATKAFVYQVKKSVHSFIRSEEFENRSREFFSILYERTPAKDMNAGGAGQGFLESAVNRMLADPSLDAVIEHFVVQQIEERLASGESLYDILPASSRETIVRSVENQAPHLLGMCAEYIREASAGDRIARLVCRLLDEVSASQTGPGGLPARDKAVENIRQYLADKSTDISEWLQRGEIRETVAEILRNRSILILKTPLATLYGDNQNFPFAEISQAVSGQMLTFLRAKETSARISAMILAGMEASSAASASSGNNAAADIFHGTAKRAWLEKEGLALLRSQETSKGIDAIVETMLGKLMARPVGRLSDLLPAGIRDGIYLAIRKMALALLAHEIPSLARSLNINAIIAEKLASVNMMNLEKNLLLVMRKRLQYISYIGALTGFCLGCLSLLFL
jgi:uncharacterized membrane protein YheB (UPF0754 family)